MQTSSIKLYSLNYNEAKTYMTAALFILGNIALPQILCDLNTRVSMLAGTKGELQGLVGLHGT